MNTPRPKTVRVCVLCRKRITIANKVRMDCEDSERPAIYEVYCKSCAEKVMPQLLQRLQEPVWV